MKTSELKVELEALMRETGEGERPILFLTDGIVFTIEKIGYDDENEAFYLHGEIDE